MVKRPMEWYIEMMKSRNFKRMSPWEEELLETASAREQGIVHVQYKWTVEPSELATDMTSRGQDGPRYRFDVTAMTQTNEKTGTVRRIIKLPARPSSREPSPSKKAKVRGHYNRWAKAARRDID